MKKLGILFFALLAACSEKPKTINKFSEFDEFKRTESGQYYDNLESVIKLKTIGNELYWQLDILDPTVDIRSARFELVRSMVFQWLMHPDPASGLPYISIDFLDEDGFTLESASTNRKPITVVDEYDEERGLNIERIRIQGRFVEKKSKLNGISTCTVKVTSNQESPRKLSNACESALKDLDNKKQ